MKLAVASKYRPWAPIHRFGARANVPITYGTIDMPTVLADPLALIMGALGRDPDREDGLFMHAS